MMFLLTVFLILIGYFAASSDGTITVDIGGWERDIETFIVFPVVILLSSLTLIIELYKFAEKRGLPGMFAVMMVIMITIFIFMFSSVFWGR